MRELDAIERIQDPQLTRLVDAYLDGSLTDAEKLKLEKELEKDEVQNYFVERLHFHAELFESQQPLRVELTQKREVVFEVKDGLPMFSKREVKSVRIGNPKTEKFVDLVTARSNRYFLLLLLGSSVALLVVVFLLQLILNQNVERDVISHPNLLLRNSSFEDNDLSEEVDGFSYSIFEWQDHFLSQRAGVIRPEVYIPEIKAPDGSNVAYMSPGSFLTQRLLLSDLSEFKAKKGMKLRLLGKIRTLEIPQTPILRCAIRVVKGIHPEMLQYEPALAVYTEISDTWRDFSIEFDLPQENMTLLPSDYSGQSTDHARAWNVEGKGLTLSLDNRGGGELLLDCVKLEWIH
jgi:hypothetical protein